MKIFETNEGVRVVGVEQCLICGAFGRVIYDGMRDRLFGASGVWSIFSCKNPECGFLWLNPQPIPEDTGSLYTGTYYTHTAPVLSRLRRLTRRLKQGYVGNLIWSSMYHQGMTPGRLLEVGCGNGLYLSEMRELGWEVVGVDFDEGAVRSAREHFKLNVLHGSLESCSFEAETFDAITSNHVIEHIHDPQNLLRECFRLLKQGGRLVITCPNSKSMVHRLFQDACYHLDPPRHLFSFSRGTLGKLAARAGFSVLSVCSTVNAARHIYITSKKIRETGKSPPDYFPTLLRRIEGVLFMLLEEAALAVDKDAGEDLVLVAKKGV